MKKRDPFWEFVKKENPKEYWYFLGKVNERLTILFQHKVPNHFDVDEQDEQLLRELYDMYVLSDLFQPSDELTDDEIKRFTDKLSDK